MALDYPITAAIRVLRDAKVEFVPHLYDYEEKGGTSASAAALGVSEHLVIKTLIMEDEKKSPLVVLMHGDAEVSTTTLARMIGGKSVAPCLPEIANKHSGYLVGGTSPFGTKRTMPVYMQQTISTCDKVYLNGGKRGFLVEIRTADVIRVLSPVSVEMRQ